MSYWVYLNADDGETLTMPEGHTEGGTIVIGGTNECCMNVTWNYGKYFAQVFDGATLKEALNGKKASDVLHWLQAGVRAFGDNPDSDYWASTPGNAGHALTILASWAEAHPDGVFGVS